VTPPLRVSFFNPVTKLLHSSWVVDARDAVEAVAKAIDKARGESAGTDIDALGTHDVGVVDANGVAVGAGSAISVAQLRAQADDINAKIAALEATQEVDPSRVVSPDQAPAVNPGLFNS
jgi:hypothetical protein